MTCKLNADTSDGLKIVSDTSGAIDLQSNGVTKVSMASSGNVSIGGNDVLTDSAKSLTASGYQTLSNGLIIQWASATSASDINFPITFPTACLSVTPGVQFNGQLFYGNTFHISGLFTTKFTITSPSASVSIRYIAIGH